MAGWLPPRHYWICRPRSCPKVLCWLLFWLYDQQRKRRGRKLRLPLDMSKQTEVCRVWFIWGMSVIQTSLRILMSSVGIIVLDICSCLIKFFFACALSAKFSSKKNINKAKEDTLPSQVNNLVMLSSTCNSACNAILYTVVFVRL